MKILIDMNLSPLWVDWFARRNIEAVHWQNVGKTDAPDTIIFEYASRNGFIVFTHDLDFCALLVQGGVMTPPCAVPQRFLRAVPSSMIAAVRNALMSQRILPSLTRLRISFISIV